MLDYGKSSLYYVIILYRACVCALSAEPQWSSFCGGPERLCASIYTTAVHGTLTDCKKHIDASVRATGRKRIPYIYIYMYLVVVIRGFDFNY